MTRFLYVMDPIATINPVSDTTLAFLVESQARGVDNLVCELKDLSARNSRGFARATRVTVQQPMAGDARFYTAHDVIELAFDDIDVIWMRKDPPVDDLFLYACMILDRHDPQRTLVLNNPTSLRIAHEKLWSLFEEEISPRQVISSRPDVLRAFVEEHGAGVIKPLAFMGGLGVMAFQKGDRNLKSAIDLLTAEGRRPAVMQEYLPAIRSGGDKRLILIDGEPAGALLRVPSGDDVRANLHAGGTATKTAIDDDDRRIAARLGPHLRELGLFFVGLDIIGGKCTEVNVTSPTGVPQINRLDGRVGGNTIEALVMDRVQQKLDAR